MDHQIFLKIFDDSQRIFLCSSFLIFLVISLKSYGGLRTKCSNNLSRDFKTIRHVKQKVKTTQVNHR